MNVNGICSTCEICIFADPVLWQCRKNPPILNHLGVSVFPNIQKDWFCSKWKSYKKNEIGRNI